MAKKNPMSAVRTKKRPTTKRIVKRKKKSRFIPWLLLFFFCVSGGIYAYFYYEWRPKQAISVDQFRASIPPGYESIGLDVSHHQGKIDWEFLLKEQHFDTIIDFVYCKATEGNTHIDTKWEVNRETLNNLGIINGAYHFFIPTDPPRPQAAHFLSHWDKRDIDLPPVLDVETEGLSDSDLIAKMKIWLELVEESSGMRPVIYTSLHFYETKFKTQFPGYKFWIAAYSRDPQIKNDPNVIHWQFSESHRIPGIREKVDLNVSKIMY